MIVVKVPDIDPTIVVSSDEAVLVVSKEVDTTTTSMFVGWPATVVSTLVPNSEDAPQPY